MECVSIMPEALFGLDVTSRADFTINDIKGKTYVCAACTDNIYTGSGGPGSCSCCCPVAVHLFLTLNSIAVRLRIQHSATLEIFYETVSEA